MDIPECGQDPELAPGGAADELLLAALLDGMDAALCAFDADGVVTHWNREAERILGWTREEALGRRGLGGWAVMTADTSDVEARLRAAMEAPGRQVHEFPLLTKDGRRILVRTQSSGVTGADGKPSGVYCAFSEAHAQIDLERSIALSEALFEDAPWGVVMVDADLRPAVVNTYAARSVRVSRSAMLGRPLGEFVAQGLEELESALQHVLAQGAPPVPAEIWVGLRPGRPGRIGQDDPEDADDAPASGGREVRRCWRSGFLRLSSPLAEEPVPMGVAWLFQDVTETKRTEYDVARLRFRDSQLHRGARAAAECEDPHEAVTVHLDFSLAGFADHALLDVVATGTGHGSPGTEAGEDAVPVRLVRAAESPSVTPGPCPLAGGGRVEGGIPVGYRPDHPALQAYDRGGCVRTSVGGTAVRGWAEARKWPAGTVHGLCAVLRSRGRTLGVVTFLRGPSRRGFDRADASYAEDIAVRIAAALDLARSAR